MGADIYGTIEIFKQVSFGSPKEWAGIVDIKRLVERNYGIFGALFGVRNYGGYTPPFVGRGLPDDISEMTAFQAGLLGEGRVGATWALWSEMEAIDWAMQGQVEESLVCAEGSEWERMRTDPVYEILEENTEVVQEQGRQIRGVIRRRRHNALADDIETLTLEQYNHRLPHRSESEISRTARWRLNERLSPGWQACFDVMRALAPHYGAEGVRIVVWFDME